MGPQIFSQFRHRISGTSLHNAFTCFICSLKFSFTNSVTFPFIFITPNSLYLPCLLQYNLLSSVEFLRYIFRLSFGGKPQTRLYYIKKLLNKCHIEDALRTPEDNKLYCSKEGKYKEFGVMNIKEVIKKVRNSVNTFEYMQVIFWITILKICKREV